MGCLDWIAEEEFNAGAQRGKRRGGFKNLTQRRRDPNEEEIRAEVLWKDKGLAV